MFGGREVVRSDLDVGLQIRTKKALMALSQLVTHSCESAGVGPRRTPFGRASNFIVVLEPDILHLVVDTAHVSAMPTHTYVDRRAKDHRRDLEGMLAHSKRSLGFARPFGVSLPLSVLQVEGEDLESQLTAVASSVCSDLLARVRMEHMGIPDWFQPLSQAFGAFLGDHPHPEKNVNLMIAGTGGDWGETIEALLQRALSRVGLELLRAQDRSYAEDPWQNRCLYMLGCSYGVAVLSPCETDVPQLRPGLDLGFMTALNRPCLMLGEAPAEVMPADVPGTWFRSIDSSAAEESIAQHIWEWLHDLGPDQDKPKA